MIPPGMFRYAGESVGDDELRCRAAASVCVSPAWERAQEQRAEGGCCMTDDANGRELQDRLEDAERRLAAIAEIAAAQVDATGTAEMDLADAESRLNRIHDLARSSP